MGYLTIENTVTSITSKLYFWIKHDSIFVYILEITFVSSCCLRIFKRSYSEVVVLFFCQVWKRVKKIVTSFSPACVCLNLFLFSTKCQLHCSYEIVLITKRVYVANDKPLIHI